MEITLDQALQKGIEAHKQGKVQEADGYYTAILKVQPNHPDANHNMGVLAVGIGKVQESLLFFKWGGRHVALRLAAWWRSSCSPWCWCGFSSSNRYLLKWCIACSRIFAPSILSSVLHMAGTECRAGPRRVLHWDDVGETQKRCSPGLRESPLDEKASSGGPPGELS